MVVLSSEFDVEWWHHIWERDVFDGFLDFAWCVQSNLMMSVMDKTFFLSAKLTCCMLCICKWIWNGFGTTSFFLDVDNGFFNNVWRGFQQTQTGFFAAKLFFDIFRRCMMFLRSLWRSFWMWMNGMEESDDECEWIHIEFTQLNDTFETDTCMYVCMPPLPLLQTEQQEQKRIKQCMKHVHDR